MTKTTLEELKIGNSDIAGWSTSAANGDTFCVYPIASFYSGGCGSIDGGAVPYDSVGCKEVAYQTLTGPDPRTFTSYTMDFATVSKASGMFNYEKLLAADKKSIPSFDNATAFATTVYNGIVARAHFNKFYLEITLTGFTDSIEVLACASQFLNAFKTKIK